MHRKYLPARRLNPLHKHTTAHRIKGCTAAVLLGIGVLAPVSEYAQAENSETSTTEKRHFNIPAGPLTLALGQFATQSGVSVTASSELTDGKSSAGLKGAYSTAEGLTALLQDTGLRAVDRGNGAFVLQTAPQEAAVLKTVKVVEGAENSTTEGTGSYTTKSMSSATGLNLSIRETPQSVSVTTRQQMDDQGLVSVTDVLRNSVGIYLKQAETSRNYPTARGFSISGIQYDGIPWGVDTGRFGGALSSSTAALDRVEVVRGATGLLTGVGQPSATINLVRKKPTTEFRGYVQASASSWDTQGTELDFSGPLRDDGRLRGRVVGAYQDGDSYIDHYSKEQSLLYGIVEYDLTLTTVLTVGIDFKNDHEDGMSFGATVPPVYSDGSLTHFSRSTNSSPGWTYADYEQTTSFVDITHQFSNGWTFRGYYEHSTIDAQNLAVYLAGYPERETGQGVAAYSFAKEVIDVEQNGAAAQLSGPFDLLGRKHELVVGWRYFKRPVDGVEYPALQNATLDSYYDLVNYPAPQVEGVANYFSDYVTRENGIYLTTRFSLMDSLTFILGARLTDVDYSQSTGSLPVSDVASTGYRYRDELVPYVGLVYDFADNYSAYASYTEIFDVQTNRDQNGRLLDPQIGKNYEVGIKASFYDDRLSASVAVFETQLDNYPVQDGFINGEPAYISTDGNKARGYELEVSGEVLSGWSVAGGLTSLAVEDGDGATIRKDDPRHLLHVSSSYRLSGNWNRLTLGGHATWQSRTESYSENFDNGASQDSYALLDVFATWNINTHVSAQVNVNNVFDKTYYTQVNNGGWAYYGAPRNVSLRMKYQF